jgi:hypothetical protein
MVEVVVPAIAHLTSTLAEVAVPPLTENPIKF